MLEILKEHFGDTLIALVVIVLIICIMLDSWAKAWGERGKAKYEAQNRSQDETKIHRNE